MINHSFPTDIYVAEGNCIDGEVRLVGASGFVDPLEGRLELCYNNAWGTVCRTEFGTNDARVVCGQLGLDRLSKSVMLFTCL